MIVMIVDASTNHYLGGIFPPRVQIATIIRQEMTFTFKLPTCELLIAVRISDLLNNIYTQGDILNPEPFRALT